MLPEEALARRAALAYLGLGLAWIGLSDLAVAWAAASEVEELRGLQLVKGAVFVVATAVLLYAVLRDQARKLAEAERARSKLAREREARLSLAMECSQEGPWELDFVAEEGHVSESCYRLFGWNDPEDRPDPFHWAELLHPKDREGVTEAVQAHLRGETERLHQTFRIRTGDRGYVWAESRGQVDRRAADGTPLHMVGTITDISDRRHLEERYRLVHAAIEVAAESMLITDTEGVIQYVNPAFERITGYSSEEALGKTPRLLKSGHHDREFYRDLWETALGGEVWHGEMVNRHRDGSLYREESSVAPLVVDDEVVALVSVKRDITREHELQEQLLQSQKLEAIGTLSGGIAHDFNNLLGIIQGHLELATEDSASPSTTAQAAREALETTRRAARLTQKLLTFARPQEPSRADLDLRSFLEEVGALLRASFPGSIQLVVEPGDEPLGTRGDPVALEQVVLNLATNAAQAVETQGGRVELRLERVREPGPPRVALVVEDDGPGMSPEVASRIFDPFYTTKGNEGTGLGLSVVHGIVEAHGGRVQVSSEPGEGTRFRVELPACEPPERPEPGQAPADPGESQPARREGNILVVDDEADLRRLMRAFLERAGYQVRDYESAVAALEAFREEPDWADLVVTDLSMPKFDGEALAQAVKEVRPDLPVLLQSGFGQRLEPPGEGTPYEVLLSKPIRRSELLEHVAELLS